MAIADSKRWRVRVSNNLPAIDTDLASLDRKNVGMIQKILSFSAPTDFEGHITRCFVGDTVPDNTDYPDTIAPIGSVFQRLVVSGGAVTGSALYLKTAAATWTVYTPAVLTGVVTAVKTANYTALVTDDIVRANTSGGAFTVTLPTAVGYDAKEFVIQVTTGGNTLTIDGDGTETIAGALTNTSLRQTGDSITLVSDGANWLIKSQTLIGGLSMTEVTVSSAEILALNATPKTILAAQGAGKIVVPVLAQFFLDYNSAAYAGIAAGEDWTLKYTDDSGAIITTIETTGFLDQTNDEHRLVALQEAAIDITAAANAAVVLHQLTDEITTGDSPVYVRLYYRVVDLQA